MIENMWVSMIFFVAKYMIAGYIIECHSGTVQKSHTYRNRENYRIVGTNIYALAMETAAIKKFDDVSLHSPKHSMCNLKCDGIC